jgi:hypothetical protein
MKVHGRKTKIMANETVQYVSRGSRCGWPSRLGLLLFASALGVNAQAQVVTIAESQPYSSGNVVLPSSANLVSSVIVASATTTRDVPAMIASAKETINPSVLPKPEVALADLQQKLLRLQEFVNPNTDNGQRWFNFLKWEELQAEIAKPQPSISKLVELEMDMRQNYNGLELAQFRDVRNSLHNYILALRYGRNPDRTVKFLQLQFDKLATAVQEPVAGSDIDRQFRLGQALELVYESGQANDLVSTLVRTYSKPNVRVLASEAFIRNRLMRPVAQPSPINEVILGTQICGQGCLLGNVTPQLIQSTRAASLRLLMSGNFSSDNVGTNRGVKIYSQGSAEVCAAESVILGEHGLTLAGDTVSDAALTTHITGIDHKLRIVEKLARKQVGKQKVQANEIGESRLRNRLRNEFHEQLTEQIARANQTLGRTPPVLGRVGLEKPVRTSWTSGNYLAVLWRSQKTSQIAANGSCPMPVPADGLTIQLHQSAIYNSADTVLAGRKIRSSDLDEYALQFGDKVPPQLAQEAYGEPWSITLQDFHPVAVSFDDDLITFLIRTERSEKGAQSLDQSATVTAKYAVALSDGGLQLVRQGDVDIVFEGDADRGTRAVILRSFLKNKFEKVFRENLFDRAIRIADELPDNVPDMNIASIKIDDGWIQATLN